MRENEPLINKSNHFGQNAHHKISLQKLYNQLSSSSEGLSSEIAKEKRHLIGLNIVKPPISAPAWLCCLLPCLLNTMSMKLYNECVPDHAMVKRNKKWINLDTASIVPGDIVRIGLGERVPADMRIIMVSHTSFVYCVSESKSKTTIFIICRLITACLMALRS